MEQILTTFGIDWRLLLINGINFGLLLLALWYFLYQPILRVLEERRTRVAEGVRNAEAAGERLQEIERSRSAVLAEAGKESDKLLAETRESVLRKEKESLARSEAATESMRSDAEREAQEIKEKALAESKQEIAKLIVLGIEKTLTKK